MTNFVEVTSPTNIFVQVNWTNDKFVKLPRFLPYLLLKVFTWLFEKLKELLHDHNLLRVDLSFLDNLERFELRKALYVCILQNKLV